MGISSQYQISLNNTVKLDHRMDNLMGKMTISAIIMKEPTTSPKKYKIVVTDGKKKATIRIGQKGYQDYT